MFWDKTGLSRRRKIALLFLILLPLSWSPGARSVTASGYDQAVLDWGGEIPIEVSFWSGECIPEMTFGEPVERITVRNTWEDDAILLEARCYSGHDCLLGLSPRGSTAHESDGGLDAGNTQEWGDYVLTTAAEYNAALEFKLHDMYGYQCHGQILIEVDTIGGESGWMLYGSEYNPSRGGLGCGG